MGGARDLALNVKIYSTGQGERGSERFSAAIFGALRKSFTSIGATGEDSGKVM
jgi:hypothetical protein